jgi:hypothetical protein
VRDHPEVAGGLSPAAEKELQGIGRLLLRPSGTEPLVRVMVEAPTSEQAQQVADASPVSCAPTSHCDADRDVDRAGPHARATGDLCPDKGMRRQLIGA